VPGKAPAPVSAFPPPLGRRGAGAPLRLCGRVGTLCVYPMEDTAMSTTDDVQRVVAEIVADLRDEANALEAAQREAQREGSGHPSSPVSANAARVIAQRIERKWGDTWA
jgi:hypothetical protein